MTKLIPYPERRCYFNDTDYLAACARVEKKIREQEEKYKTVRHVANKNVGVLSDPKPKPIKDKTIDKGKKIVADGRKFNNINEASIILNMSVSNIFKYIMDDDYPDWKYVD